MPESFLLPALGGLLAGACAVLLPVLVLSIRRRRAGADLLSRARREAERVTREAERETRDAERAAAEGRRAAETVRAEAAVAAREESLRLREALEQEHQRRREEWERRERRAEEQDRAHQRRGEELAGRARRLEEEEARVAGRDQVLAERHAEAEWLVGERRQALERAAGLSAEDARRELVQKVEDEARSAAAALARDIKEQARRDAEREARRIVSIAIQRIAPETTAESTVAAVSLPSDDMKGRIIGREGRNIRAFETATGVDVIIDDTPDTVVVSCFDPIRREVARRALEALIADGRIHPGRIEELVVKVRAELDKELVELGERAAYETGIHGLHPELVRLVGRMRYRTSYGQNILEHSKEVAWLAGIMAAELGVDVALAKRGALLHDVGKVLTHDTEGTHVELGVEVARKYGEAPLVINCIQAHHNDVPHESTESVLVQAADGISGSRPGARREAFETYVKRLTKLEEIAHGFAGVEKANVIQAGREVRVIVTPDRVDDGGAAELSELIARRIEEELQYPGQIKVVVVRETRAVGIAR